MDEETVFDPWARSSMEHEGRTATVSPRLN
jgi:hypothetical protein